MNTTTVVVDALSAHFGGGGNYLLRQLAAVEEVAPELSLHVVAGPWNEHALRNTLHSPVFTVDVSDGLPRVGWEQLVLPRRLVPGALLYCPGNTVPLLARTTPTIVTLQNPNMVGAGRRLAHNRRWYRQMRVWLTRQSLRRAQAVVVISESLGAQVLADLPSLTDRMVVIASGAPDVPDPTEDRRPEQLVVDPGDYFLSLANDAPHKGLDHTVLGWARAFDDLAPDQQVPALVMVGVVSATRREHQRRLVSPSLRERLIHAGPIDDRRQLTWLLRHARALVSSSELEANPLTPAEAGSVGCPIVLSDIPSHREVAGPHATYFPLGEPDALARALVSVPAHGSHSMWRPPTTWSDNARALVGVFHDTARRTSSGAVGIGP